MWVIDIRHWLDETKSGPAVPQLNLKVKKLSEKRDVVDKLYKLKHLYSAAVSARHRMSICPTVLLFQLMTRRIG